MVPQQMAFIPDGKTLLVALKGYLPTDANNPSGKVEQGLIGIYTITDYVLSNIYTKQDALAPGEFPFSIANDYFVKNAYFFTDVLTGAVLPRFKS